MYGGALIKSNKSTRDVNRDRKNTSWTNIQLQQKQHEQQKYDHDFMTSILKLYEESDHYVVITRRKIAIYLFGGLRN